MIRKIVFLFLLISCCFRANAQVRFALVAGGQKTSARYLINGNRQSTDWKNGYMAGVGLKVDFEKQLYFFPMVSYSLKGYQVDFTETAYPPSVNALNNNTTIHAIDIAPLLQFDFSKNPSHLFLRVGPSVDVVIRGSEKFDTLDMGGTVRTVDQAMKFSYVNYGRYSASLNAHLGYQSASGFMIFAHYAHGIGSMNNNDDGPRIVHRIGGITAGWLFRNRKKKGN